MKKKLIILIVFILLLVVSGGVFWWERKRGNNVKTTQGDVISEEVSVSASDFKVIGGPDGKIVRNKKEGLSFKIPKDWIMKKYDKEIDLLSPDTELDKYGNISPENIKQKRGCGISVMISKCKKVNSAVLTRAEIIKSKIVQAKENPKEAEEKGYKFTEIDGKPALKTIVQNNGKEKPILVEVPLDNTIYSFGYSFIFLDRCSQAFENFLGSVSIK